MKPHPTTNQRGASTLAITLVLAFVVLLGVTFANRSMLFEVKTSANQYRAAQAREAAEAGLDWAIAQLNGSSLVGDDCLPGTGSQATPFRERILAASQADCIESDGGWSCRCPASGELPARDSDEGRLAFGIRFTADGQLTSTGLGGDAAGTRSQVRALIGRVPGLDSLPAAALTVRGGASFSHGAFSVLNTQPAAGGMTVHAGGGVDAATLQLVSAPGAPVATSVLADEPALASLTASQLFASLFRMDKATWRSQPAVRELDCQSACDAALAEATAAGTQLLWLRGGLKLASAPTLGSPQRPVVLVADGPVELGIGVTIHGVVYATDPAWADTAGATVRGAVIFEGDLKAAGNSRIQHDLAILQTLHDHTGSHARVPGSWRDF